MRCVHFHKLGLERSDLIAANCTFGETNILACIMYSLVELESHTYCQKGLAIYIYMLILCSFVSSLQESSLVGIYIYIHGLVMI